MNVNEYFNQQFEDNSFPPFEGSSVPIDSTVGKMCKLAILAGKQFQVHVEYVSQDSKGVIQVTYEICRFYCKLFNKTKGQVND